MIRKTVHPPLRPFRPIFRHVGEFGESAKTVTINTKNKMPQRAVFPE
jgi:hypothetical protein